MRIVRLLVVSAWAGYLVYAGLAMLLLPWSAPWPALVRRLPPVIAMVLDHPATRGAISGFGALHLLVMAAELLRPSLHELGAGERGADRRPPAAGR